MIWVFLIILLVDTFLLAGIFGALGQIDRNTRKNEMSITGYVRLDPEQFGK